jgi:gas vesicle protein
MNNETPSPALGPILLAFLAGAAAGAVLVALTTPKSGPDLRGDIKDLARRAKLRTRGMAHDASGAWQDLKERTLLAAADLRHGVADSVHDLKQPVPGHAAETANGRGPLE